MKFFWNIFYILSIVCLGSEVNVMENACAEGINEACFELGSIYSGNDVLKINLKKSKIYYEKACFLGNDNACLEFEKIK